MTKQKETWNTNQNVNKYSVSDVCRLGVHSIIIVPPSTTKSQHPLPILGNSPGEIYPERISDLCDTLRLHSYRYQSALHITSSYKEWIQSFFCTKDLMPEGVTFNRTADIKIGLGIQILIGRWCISLRWNKKKHELFKILKNGLLIQKSITLSYYCNICLKTHKMALVQRYMTDFIQQIKEKVENSFFKPSI